MAKYRIDTEDGSVYEVETEDAPAAPKQEQAPALSRFLTSLGEMVNVPGGIWQGLTHHDPRAQWKTVNDVLKTPRGSEEEQWALEQGMKTPLSNPLAVTPPPGLEVVPAVTGQAMQGNLAGAAGTALGAAAVPYALSKIPSMRLRLPGTQSLNPEEAAAIKWAQDRGIFIPGGAATGNFAWKGIQYLTGTTPLGMWLQQKMMPRTAEGLRQAGRELSEQAHPQVFTPETAGTATTEGLSSKVGTLAGQADIEYQVLRDLESNPRSVRTVQQGITQDGQPRLQEVAIPVNIRELKQAIRPIYNHMSMWMEPAARNASAGYQAMRSILDSEDWVPATVAEAGLGGIKELAREGSGRSAGLAKNIVPRLQRVIDDAVGRMDPNALTSLREGREITAAKAATENILKRVSGNLGEAVPAYRRLTQPDDANIGLLRQVQKEVPGAIGPLARAYLEDILSIGRAEGGLPKRADAVFAGWDALGPESRKILYPNAALREGLDRFFLTAKKVAENPNPSGTAIVSALTGQSALLLTHPLSGAVQQILGAAGSALLWTPGGVRLLTKGLTTPTGRSAAALGLWAQIAAMAGRQRNLTVSNEMDMPAPSGVSDDEKIRRLLEESGRPMLPAGR